MLYNKKIASILSDLIANALSFFSRSPLFARSTIPSLLR